MRIRVIPVVVASAAVLALLAVGLYFSGVFSNGDAAKAQVNVGGSNATCSTTYTQHFYTLDEGKEVPLAFGPSAKQDSITADLQELHNRRSVDPVLMAAHEAYEGFIPETTQAISTEETKLMNDRAYWCGTLDKMEKAEAGYTTSIDSNVPAGMESLYMVATSDKEFVNVYTGSTSHPGTALVFTKPDGTNFEFRLDCGFQPVTPKGGFPHLPKCDTNTTECSPPTCEEKNGGLECKIDAQNPVNQGNANTGGGKNDTTGPGASLTVTQPATVYVPPAVAPAPAPSASASPDPAPPAPHESALPVAPVVGCVPTPTVHC